MSNIQQHCPEYFEENEPWSLLNYLEYKQERGNLIDRGAEHLAYRRNLEYLANNGDDAQRGKAKESLETFQVSAFYKPYFLLPSVKTDGFEG